MKRILHTVIFFVAVSLCMSCGADIEETITLDDQYQGTYEVQTDMIPMMRSMAYQFAVFAKSADGNEDEGGKIDSAKIEADIFKDMPEVVDSIIPLHKMTKEATLSPEDKIKLEKQLKMYMKGGKKSGQMIMGMLYTFTSIQDLNELNAIMERNKESSEDSKLKQLSGNVSYTLSGNTFTRIYSEKTKASSNEENEELLAQMMFKNTFYRTTVNSKRKILKAKGSGLKMQKDHQVVFEYPMKDYMDGTIKQDFILELE